MLLSASNDAIDCRACNKLRGVYTRIGSQSREHSFPLCEKRAFFEYNKNVVSRRIRLLERISSARTPKANTGFATNAAQTECLVSLNL